MARKGSTVVEIAPKLEGTKREARERAWAIIEQIGERNADKDPDEVLRDVTEVVEEVRRELYDEERRTAPDRR